MKFKWIVLFFMPAVLFGQSSETLPTWHWAYTYVDVLRLRQGFEELYSLNKPYTRGDVAEALVRIEERMEDKKLYAGSFYLGLFERLRQEFKEEILEMGVEPNESGGGKDTTLVQAGLRVQTDLDKGVDAGAEYRGVYRTKIGVPLGKHVFVYNGINFDQYLKDDPLYVGKKWRGIVGYTEQAYVTAAFGRFRLKFGRDFLEWGAGRGGTLLFSNVARPMDQFSASVRMGPLRYSFVASVLDEMTISDSLNSFQAKRYISAHRLDGWFFKGRLQVAVTEAIVYGGENRNLDWVYINPFIFYHGEQLNKSGLGNTLGTLDVMGYPARNCEVYGSFLIDDIQIEKTGPGDLEPREVGCLAGMRWADPFGVSGMTLAFEYTSVTNRTYKTPNAWETFIHRNVTLGHPLGNDFDRWQAGLSQWFLGTLQFQLQYSQIRKGEGSLYTPFDTPWFDYTVEQGYSEPFPTGIVEHRKQLDLSFRFYPSVHWGMEADVQLYSLTNAGHVEGEKRNDAVWRVGFWWDGEVIIKIKDKKKSYK